MPEKAPKTIRVKDFEDLGREFILINESDFDPDIHERLEPPVAKKKATKSTASTVEDAVKNMPEVKADSEPKKAVSTKKPPAEEPTK